MTSRETVNPFFIIGNPRSGTSMFRLMLNSHPQVTVPPECGFALWFSDKYFHRRDFTLDLYQEFADDVAASRKFETWDVRAKDIVEELEEIKPTTYVGLVCAVYMAYGRRFEKHPLLVGDKNNYYIKELDKINHFFPESRVIYMIRDGRDVVCSYRELNGGNINSQYRPKFSESIEEIALEWAENAKRIASKIDENSILVKYEDLVLNPTPVLSKVCSFLGVEFDEAMLEFYKVNDEPEEFLQWKRKTLEFPDAKRVGRYKSELKVEEQAVILECAGEMLNRFRYLD